MFWRYLRGAPLFIAVIACNSLACKQRSQNPIARSIAGPQVPNIDILPVDDARVEELRILFKTTLEKVLSNPEAAKKAMGLARLGSNAKPKTYIVRLRPSAPFMLNGENPDTPLLAAGGIIKKRLDMINAVTVEFPDATDENHMLAVGKFLTDSLHVLSVEPDLKVKALGAPNDPRFSELWGLNSSSTPRVDIRALTAWSRSTGSANVVVGVVDTGIDYTHKDLQGNIWLNPGETGLDAKGRDKQTNKVDDDNNGYIDDFRGWDFVSGDNDPMDQNNHGTHVAGTIGATGNNAIGVVGVNWTVKMAPLRFLDANGEGYVSDAITAIQYATKMRFFATNHSWGGGDFSQAMFDAIKAANSAGQLFIAAAGNESQNNDSLAHYPSGYQLPNVIAVAAVNKSGALAWFSNYGKTRVHVAAPGSEILSTIIGNGYATYQGTSMATPHVTGLAALIKAATPNITAAEIKNNILNSVTPLSGLSGKTITGGMINAETALGYLKDTSPPNAPTGVSLVWRGVSQAKVSWSPATDSNPGGVIKGYEIRQAADPISSEAAWNGAAPISNIVYSNSTSLVSAVLSLSAGFQGFVAIRALDADDNLSPLTASLAINLLPVNQVASYSGDSLNGFSATPWVIESDSLRGKVFSDGVGNYPANAKRHLKVPTIPLRAYDSLILKFWHRLDIENNYDKGVLTIESNVANSEIEVKSFSQKIGDWQYVEIDLSSQLAVLQMQENATNLAIGFKLVSDSSVQADGWYVDDIELEGTPSVITVSGVPDNSSISSSYQITLSQTSEQSAVKIENYKASLQQGVIQDCSSLLGLDSRPISEPFVGTTPDLGKVVFCIIAPLKDYAFNIKRYYVWNRVAPNPPVVSLSGFPTGPSNQSSLTGRVSGSNVAFYSYHVAIDDEKDCDTASFTNWIDVSEPLIVHVSKDQKNILCVKGKSLQGEVQSGYTKISWITDFTAPISVINGEPPVSSVNPKTELTVAGADVASFKYAVTTSAESCVSYSSVMTVDKKIVLTAIDGGDGERRVCVKGIDLAGNVQENPTVLTWIQDTVAQPVGFSGLPTPTSNVKNLSVTPLAGEIGQYRYVVKAGSTCDANALFSSPLRSLSEKIIDTLPPADGTYTLCAILIDTLGNVQKTATQYTWIKDTVPPVAALSNLPPAKTGSMSISVYVSGDGMTSYRYSIVLGSSTCAPGSYKTNLVSEPIRETFTTKGQKKLCVVGVDGVGNIQTAPTVYAWEIGVAPILTAGLLRVPSTPNSKQLLNIGVTSPAGQNITTYRYGFAPGLPSNCARMTSWSSYRSVSTPITDNLASYQGYRTLCIIGKNVDGFEQMTPTMASWFKIDGAQTSPSATLFGAVSIVSKTSTSVTFRVTRGALSGAQRITAKVCPLDWASGAIKASSCKSNLGRFSSSDQTLDLTQSGLLGGNYVIVVLPPGGRVEPLNFSL